MLENQQDNHVKKTILIGFGNIAANYADDIFMQKMVQILYTFAGFKRSSRFLSKGDCR